MKRRFAQRLTICAATVATVAVLVARPAAQWGSPESSVVLATYEAWLAGDANAITKSFASAEAFQEHRADLQRVLRAWVRTWKPSQAAFLLELSLVAFDRRWDDAATLLGGTRDLVIGRRDPPGTNPDEDAFERTFHRSAITFFLSRQLLNVAHDYMNVLAGRVDIAPSTTGKPRLVDPWMTFARAMANDIATSPSIRPIGHDTTSGDTLAIPPDDRAVRSVAEAAALDYERVGASPEVAAEASVRRGLLLLRLGRHDEALAAFARADAADADATVRYLSALFRGRTLDALDRVAEAAAAYERAASLVPAAQTPAVALASLWHRHGRPDEALAWAQRAVAAPGGLADPWHLYWYGDLRRAGERLTALRQARP